MNSYLKATLVFIGFFLANCGSNTVDIVPPSMEEVMYSPQPLGDEICGAQEPVVFRLTNNQELTFDAVFRDDEALSQYKIDIHNNFDCHGHGGGSAPSIPNINVENQTIDWAVLDIQNLSGLSSAVARTLTVPDNVTAGNYHFHIQVIDESGNDSPFANFTSLKIKNLRDTIPPQIMVDLPLESTFSINKGEALRFAGQVVDNRSLSDGGNGILYLANTDLSSGNTLTTDKAFAFESNVDKVFDFDFEYIVPQTLISNRTYRFSIGANDGVRNVGEFVFFDVLIQ